MIAALGTQTAIPDDRQTAEIGWTPVLRWNAPDGEVAPKTAVRIAVIEPAPPTQGRSAAGIPSVTSHRAPTLNNLMEHVGVRGVPKFLDFHTRPGLAVHRDRRGARRAVPRKTASLLPPADACDPNESTAYFEPIRNDSDSTC